MFGQNLARLRKEKKLSQYKLAEMMNFSRGQIANYEQGSREPDFETLQKFADFFDVTTDRLLGRTETMRRVDELGIPEHSAEMRSYIQSIKDLNFDGMSIQEEKEILIKSMESAIRLVEAADIKIKQLQELIDSENESDGTNKKS